MFSRFFRNNKIPASEFRKVKLRGRSFKGRLRKNTKKGRFANSPYRGKFRISGRSGGSDRSGKAGEKQLPAFVRFVAAELAGIFEFYGGVVNAVAGDKVTNLVLDAGVFGGVEVAVEFEVGRKNRALAIE